jgi:hypothetical protein
MALAKLGVLYRAFLCTPRYIISETVDYGVVTSGFASGSGEALLRELTINNLGPVSIWGTGDLTEKSSNTDRDPGCPIAYVPNRHL